MCDPDFDYTLTIDFRIFLYRVTTFVKELGQVTMMSQPG